MDLSKSDQIQKRIQDFIEADGTKAAGAPYVSRILLQKDSSGQILDRPVALMFHGLFMSPEYFDQLQSESWDAGYHVMNIRLPGHFEKDFAALDKTKADEFVAKADEAYEIARSLNPVVNLAGHSTGGLLAAYLARKNQDHQGWILLFAPALQVNPMTKTLVEMAIARGLSGKEILFWKKQAGSIYRSTWAAQQVQLLSMKIGLPPEERSHLAHWLEPLTKKHILMIDTALETAVDLKVNKEMAAAMHSFKTFEYLLMPTKNMVLHNGVGRFPAAKFPQVWDKIRALLQRNPLN